MIELPGKSMRPTGLGTSAARIADLFNQAVSAAATPAAAAAAMAAVAAAPEVQSAAAPEVPGAAGVEVPGAPVDDPAYADRPWGDRKGTPLYCPLTERINEPLAEAVDERVAEWSRECGFDDEAIERIRKARFGRLAMLCHPDSEDPDRLLIAAKLNAAWWAADDYYADDRSMGAVPEQLPPRLVLAMAAMDPLPPAGAFTPPLEETLAGDKVLVSLRSATEHLSRYGTPGQVQRMCYATFSMFVSWCAYAAWRFTGQYPPAWKYLSARQHDSFYTSMTLCDVVGGYELPANLFYDPRVRHAAFLAGTAVVMLNDLYSVKKDLTEDPPPCNMVLQVAADRGCSLAEATETVVRLHNELVRDFQARHRSLLAVPSVELQRFLRALRGWMGGAFEWHDSNPRYRT